MRARPRHGRDPRRLPADRQRCRQARGPHPRRRQRHRHDEGLRRLRRSPPRQLPQPTGVAPPNHGADSVAGALRRARHAELPRHRRPHLRLDRCHRRSRHRRRCHPARRWQQRSCRRSLPCLPSMGFLASLGPLRGVPSPGTSGRPEMPTRGSTPPGARVHEGRGPPRRNSDGGGPADRPARPGHPRTRRRDRPATRPR